MEISDGTVITGFTFVIGALTGLAKLYHSQLRKEQTDDKSEFCAYKKESEGKFKDQQKHIDECNEERKEQATKIERLEVLLGVASSCEMVGCPRKAILGDSQRHTVRPVR